MPQVIPAQTVDLSFPLGGIDVSMAFGRQPNRDVGGGQYGRTTLVGTNVRAIDPASERLRGGSRPMLARYVNAQPNGSNPFQCLDVIVGAGYNAPGGGTQSSGGGRIVTLVAVSGGNVYVFDAGATAWTTATNNTGVSPPLIASGIVQSFTLGQRMYFVDGTNSRYYDPSTNSVENWVATQGSFPLDSALNKPKLCALWRGRAALSGLSKDPHNWFLSKVEDATDFNYFPGSPVPPDSAVAGNNSPLGKIGDVVTTIVPVTDDVCIWGGDSSIYRMSGDPMAGGQLDLVTASIGMAWGTPWAMDPAGMIYFWSNRNQVYRMAPNGQPVPLSRPIYGLLKNVNTGTHTIKMMWDDSDQVLHVFVTTTAAATQADEHWLWESRSGGWWKVKFANADHNPLACVVFDGNLPGDRVALIGSWDGYVRYFTSSAALDDGTACASEVWIGPIESQGFEDMMIKELQAIFGDSSGAVSYAVHVGVTAETARGSVAVATGTFNAGRGMTQSIRRSGHAIYLRLYSSSPWAMERIRCLVMDRGRIRRRTRF